MSDKNFGDRLSYVLGLHKLTQKEAGKRAGISENAFVNYVKNRRIPSGDILERIARLCDVSIEYLISGTINQNYCYEIAATIRLNKIPISKLAQTLSVRPEFIEALISADISPSTDFFTRIINAIGVTPQGNLRDRTEKKDHDQPNHEFLIFKIAKLERDVAEREEYIETLLNEIQTLKLEIHQLKKTQK